MRILLIEDKPDHVFLARQAVEQVWPEVALHIVRDVEEVIARYCQPAASLHFDLILASLATHESQRLLSLRQMQTHPRLAHTPVIALVSSTRDQELAQVAHHPADWIILKPLKADALREALRRKPLP